MRFDILFEIVLSVVEGDSGFLEKFVYFNAGLEPEHTADLALGKDAALVSISRPRLQRTAREIRPLLAKGRSGCLPEDRYSLSFPLAQRL